MMIYCLHVFSSFMQFVLAPLGEYRKKHWQFSAGKINICLDLPSVAIIIIPKAAYLMNLKSCDQRVRSIFNLSVVSSFKCEAAVHEYMQI